MKRFKTYAAAGFIAAIPLASCGDNTYRPELPEQQGVAMAQGVSLNPDVLFGVWEGTVSVGTDNSNHFEQSYKIEFLSVEDGEAILTHTYNDAATNIEMTNPEMGYTYSFDGSRIVMTPEATSAAAGASEITGVHIGNNRMVLYTSSGNLIDSICEITRTGDPEPAVTDVNRTLPQPGEVVTISGRNLQFVDHLWLPTSTGETELKDFTANSREIQFMMPEMDVIGGFIRCESEGAHMSSYTPAMFCSNCIFFHDFSAEGGSKPDYIGTEFENTIGITQSLTENVFQTDAENLPEGHSLTFADTSVINPDKFVSLFAETPQPWDVDTSLDPSGYIRFSFGDCINRVIESSEGLLTKNTKCEDAAIEMDVYVYSNGQPLWNTGFLSFRLNKDAQKTINQQWFAQTAMWDSSSPVSFTDGWHTFRIPMSEFRITSQTQYSTLGGLANYLLTNKIQSLIKLVNYQLDTLHPAQTLNSFQMNIADIRLVPLRKPN